MTDETQRLLLIDPAQGLIAESDFTQLPELLQPQDLLVVNDAATMPASLAGTTRTGEPVEIRLLDAPYAGTTRAVLFGRGSYRLKTEHRPAPPALTPGDVIRVGARELRVNEVSPLSPRLVELAWPGELAERFALLYGAGRPVQYSYIEEPLELWDVQTSFASRPWAAEMPSAARPLRGASLLALQRRGVGFASLTHAAGLSATGDPALDAALPLPERYEIPEETVALVQSTRARGGRVIAVGTSVVRALEDSAARWGQVRSGPALATLILDADTKPRVVSGLLTGIHVPGESHYRLLSAFADARTLWIAAQLAVERQYRMHEFGDSALLLPGLVAAQHAA